MVLNSSEAVCRGQVYGIMTVVIFQSSVSCCSTKFVWIQILGNFLLFMFLMFVLQQFLHFMFFLCFLVCDFSMVFCFYVSGYLLFSHSFKCYIVDYFFTDVSLCLLVNVFHCTRLECMPLFILCLVFCRSMDGVHYFILACYIYCILYIIMSFGIQQRLCPHKCFVCLT